MTVSAEQRSALARAVARLRRIFEEDFASLAEGKFGIHVSETRAGELEDVSALSLSAQDLASRAELVGVLDYLKHEGLSPAEAVDRMLREAVFTTVNRLLAIRVAEAIGILPPSLAQGRTSQGFLEAVEAFPLLRDADTSGGYWTYLQICGDELSHAVPRLFDRRHPLTALAPSPEAVNEAVEVLADTVLADVWTEPEALGWSYQFFNTSEERKAMREASPAPRDSRELAVRNQFFTPRYVVDFLVQNTLGRRLREAGFTIALPLLLGELDDDPPGLDLRDIAVLDPAVGSGHFLLGAYDLLEQAWEEIGVDPANAAPAILQSLYGIEIDPRAAQVAQATLYLRARRSSPEARLEPAAIVTARALPTDELVWKEVLENQPPLIRDVLTALKDALDLAPELGSLLKVEEVVAHTLNARLARPQLGDDTSDPFEALEASVIASASDVAERAEATPAERLFAAEAQDALRFVNLCRARYDVVFMNPPFGEPIPSTKDYIKAAWPWIPWKDSNILAAFVGRGVELLKPGGYLGAITSRVGFFLVTYQAWREEVVVPRIRAMADLGHGVMEEALVEAAAYVLSQHPKAEAATFRRLLKAVDKESAMYALDPAEIYSVTPSEFTAVPGSPMAYWVSPLIRRSYERFPALEEAIGKVRQGLATADDFRFLRLWWEVPPQSVGWGKRWVFLAKGGEYSPYRSDLHLVINWEREGADIRAFDKAVVRSPDLYGRPGFTWAERTASSLSFGPLPAGCIFSSKGPAVIPGLADASALPVLNSRVFRTLVELLLAAGDESASGTAARDYTVGTMKVVPYPTEVHDGLGALGRALWETVTSWLRESEETSPFFAAFRFDRDWERRAAASMDLSLQAEVSVLKAYEFDSSGAEEIDQLQGPHPATYPRDATIDEAEFRRLYAAAIDDLVDEVVDRLGGGRYLSVKSYFLDRRLELLAHLFRAHPETLVEFRDRLGLEQRGQAHLEAVDRLSYLVGVAFGRWDARVGSGQKTIAPSGDPFDAVPPCAPGMLVGSDGLPARDAPEGYPAALPPERILHDDPGHTWDVVRAVELAAEIVCEDADRDLRAALGHLKVKDVRTYVRSQFFPEHLARYSKSRRKAPIYWYLAVPSKDWGLWVYAPWLSREQLFAIARAAQDKLRRLSDEASQLRRDVQAGGGREVRERLEEVETLVEEVEEFARVADRVAQSGWEPDLNDGIILNAAPLEELFADAKWRREVAKHRKKMEKGEYPWATVQQTYFKGSS